MTQTLNVSDARKQFSSLVNKVTTEENTRILVAKSGAAVAAIVSADDLKRLEALDAKRERDFAILDEIGATFADVSQKDLEYHVAKAVEEIRGEAQKGYKSSSK
jgi:prevent-host-death family protein